MVTVFDVTPNKLITRVAEKLKGLNLPPPAWIGMVKSGSQAQRVPEQEDFWYIRLASLLRNSYVKGKVGVSSLRSHYGGKKVRGVRPEHQRRAGGAIIRKGLQSLEKIGLMEKKKKGRELTAAGRKLLDSAAKEVS